jgi:hypothetical protein
MATKTNSEDMQQIIEVLRYLVLKVGGVQMAPEKHKKAKATIDALVVKYKVPVMDSP